MVHLKYPQPFPVNFDQGRFLIGNFATATAITATTNKGIMIVIIMIIMQ